MATSPSFEAVFEAECGYVIHSLRRLGVPERDLEDLAQDVFIAIHRRFAEYDGERPLRPWLFAFAFRAASNHRRLARHRREAVFESSPADHVMPPTQEKVLLDGERRRVLLDALATLDLKHRAALILVDLDGVPPKEVSRNLDVPLDTVYSRVRNGRKKLRAALTQNAAELNNGAQHG